MKIVLDDDEKMAKRFERVNGKVQFVARHGTEKIGSLLIFENGRLTIKHEICAEPDIEFGFASLKKMNAFLAGKPILPRIRGVRKIGLLTKVLSLLLGIKILLPTSRPKSEQKKKLKVKAVIYMITTALSQYNRDGDDEMLAWTQKQPDRVYQMSVESEESIAAYLRIKAGKSKSGRGIYTRRRPFVHMKFKDVDSALSVFLKDVEFVDAVSKGYIRVVGSPEYAANLNDFMQRIQALVA
jgi:hypothetical protein